MPRVLSCRVPTGFVFLETPDAPRLQILHYFWWRFVRSIIKLCVVVTSCGVAVNPPRRVSEWRSAMGSSCGHGASNLVWCVVVGFLSLVIPTLGQAGCPGDLTNIVTKFETQNLICKQYSFPRANPYVIWAARDNGTQVVTMVVSMPLSPNKWAGLAFSADGQMPGSSALIATLSSAGAPIINQYSLDDRTQAGVVKGGKGIVFYKGPPEGYYDPAGSTVYMSFQADFAKSTAKANYLLMAYGSLYRDSSPNQHDQRAYFDAEFVSGVVAGKSAASKLNSESKFHGLLQIIGWGLLLPIGALVARYARAFDPAWFYIHVAFQLVGFACIIAGVATGIQLAKDFQPDHLPAHRGLGLFLFGLAILQVLAVGLRPKKDAKVRKYWNWYHAGVGRIALFLAVINIFLGLTMAKAEDHFTVAYIAILSIEFLIFIILEVWLWRRWSQQQPTRQQPNLDPPVFQFGGSV